MITQYYVEIVEFVSDKVVKKIGPISIARTAKKVKDEASINLNHDKYYTRLKEVQL